MLNFWQGTDHVRGVWRRTTIADYARKSPHWQTLLDVDQLDARLHKAGCGMVPIARPTFNRCLVQLSPGGGDAAETREYDPGTRSFVPGGFELPVAKGGAVYLSRDAVLVATDFGPGTMTPSSYPQDREALAPGRAARRRKNRVRGQTG